MKVGDLVELSATGRTLSYCGHARDKVGIVVDIKSKIDVMYPIRVNWMGGKAYAYHLRSSLKFISKTS